MKPTAGPRWWRNLAGPGLWLAMVSGALAADVATARLTNIATRAQSGGSAGAPIAGFVLRGTGTRQMLVRAGGPSLNAFGVSGALADPSLALVSGTATLASNDNWLSTDAALMAATGAYSFSQGSKDAALATSLAAGAYTCPVSGANNTAGVVLVEVYDAAVADANGPTIINASTRAFVGTGASVLIPGFTISGSGSLPILIRAVGPGLASFGVSGTLADPVITLYRDSTALATNDNWSTASNAVDQLSFVASAVESR